MDVCFRRKFFILKEILLVFLEENMYIYAEQRKNRREECIYEEKKQKSGRKYVIIRTLTF